MYLLVKSTSMSLEEWVHLWPLAVLFEREQVAHVFPAVQMTKSTNLRLNHTSKGITGALAENKSLNVGRLNLAAVVDNITMRVDDDLGHVEAVAVNLGIAQGDVDLSSLGCRTDASHLIGIRVNAILVVLLKEGERVLIVDTPLPVGVSDID